jgi:hypothetical protein
MRRREFIRVLSSSVVAWPLTARAQPAAMPVIGYLDSRARGDAPQRLAAVLQGLNDTGFVEGQNVAIEYRFAENRDERLPALAEDLVQRRVAVITRLVPPRQWQQRRQPRQYLSPLKRALTQFGSASLPTLIGQAATSPA